MQTMGRGAGDDVAELPPEQVQPLTPEDRRRVQEVHERKDPVLFVDVAEAGFAGVPGHTAAEVEDAISDLLDATMELHKSELAAAEA